MDGPKCVIRRRRVRVEEDYVMKEQSQRGEKRRAIKIAAYSGRYRLEQENINQTKSC